MTFWSQYPLLPLPPGQPQSLPSGVDPRDALSAVDPPDPPAPVLTTSTGPQSACQHCGASFAPKQGGGVPQKYCSPVCRRRTNVKLRNEKLKATGWPRRKRKAPAVEPVADWERPYHIPVEQNLPDDEAFLRERAAALRPPPMPWERRELEATRPWEQEATRQVIELNEREGIANLPWRTGNGAAT
jgi:hypothetical protein